MRSTHRNEVASRTGNSGCHARGFTLLELMITMAVFLVVGGAAVSLVARHVPVFTTEQNQAALNFGLRNAVTQMQIDVANAGEGYYQAADTAGWPIGITVKNQQNTTGCWNATTLVYSASCFDTINIIASDRSTPPSHPSNSSGGVVSTTSTTDLYLTPTGTTTLAQLAGYYKQNDQILLVSNDGTQMTTAKLTADAVVSGAYVKLVHTQTTAGGINASTTNDPYSISTNVDASGLTDTFDNNDWVIKLAPITYSVDTSNATNPRLMRAQAATSGSAATNDVIAEQVVGFKVGVSQWNGTTDQPYVYNSWTYSTPDFTKVRAVRVTVIGRTPPDISNRYRNSFDGGPYKIEAVSVVVNPRNLSMKDQ